MSKCQIDKDTEVFSRPVWPLAGAMNPLAPLPASPACARAFANLTLSSWGVGDQAESANLVLSELVTNAVNASSPSDRDARIEVIRVYLFADSARVVIEVWDEAAWIPQKGEPGEFEESGRGLMLVDSIAAKWEWWPSGRQGKCVWAELFRLGVVAGAPITPLTARGRHAFMAYHSGDICRSRLDEAVRRHVLELITAEPSPRPARDWLLFLGQTAAGEIAGRLARYAKLEVR